MMQTSANVVVIGGGVIGTSTAMHLARMGAGKVLLLEKGHLAGGASGRSGAMVREHYPHPILVRMATEASAIFHNFGDAVGGDARFVETGRLLLFAERDAAAARANVAMNRELGVDIRVLAPSGIAEIVPNLSTEGVALGVYEPNAGHADPMATTYAFAEQARNHGAEIRTECAVTGIKTAGGRVVAVETEAGPIEDGRRGRGHRTLDPSAGRALGRVHSDHAHQGADGAPPAPPVPGDADHNSHRPDHRGLLPGQRGTKYPAGW